MPHNYDSGDLDSDSEGEEVKVIYRINSDTICDLEPEGRQNSPLEMYVKLCPLLFIEALHEETKSMKSTSQSEDRAGVTLLSGISMYL